MQAENNDIHLLNWGKFENASAATTAQSKNDAKAFRTVNKGIFFEDLVEKLLAAMFPAEDWRRTCESHDGKRDFVFPSDDCLPDIKWAECKNYKSNVSINVIAPTLIMGSMEDIKSIFFFSYSPLNDNAIDALIRYSKASGKEVKVFDGNLLESLICKFNALNGIADYFPNDDFKKVYETIKRKKPRTIKILRDVSGNIISPEHIFANGESFCVSVIVQNLIQSSIDCKISMKWNKKDYLACSSTEYKCSLSFAGLDEYTFACQPLKAGNITGEIKISTNDNEEYAAASVKIKIVDEPYLFWSGENSLAARKQCAEHLEQHKTAPLVISAGSGMGKSTLINILLQEQSILDSYIVLRIDTNLTRDCCAKNLFSRIIGVRGENETPQDQEKDSGKALETMLGSYAESAAEIAGTIMNLYDSHHPYLFVIDDVQQITRQYTTLINALDDIAKKENKPIFYLLALNEDACTINKVLSSLNWDTCYQNRKYDTVYLKKFVKQDILAYIKHRLGLAGFDSFLSDFDGEVRPLEICNFCASIKAQKIVEPIPNKPGIYQIVDPFRFSESAKKHFCSGASIKSVCDSIDNSDISGFILKYLYLTNSLDAKLLLKHHSIIDRLISFGILKKVNETVVFFHEEMRNSVKSMLEFSVEDYADIFSEDSTDALSKAFCALYSSLQIRGGTEQLKAFFNSRQSIQEINRRYEICWMVFEKFDLLAKHGLSKDALQYVQSNFKDLNSENGHTAFFSFLQHVADTALICCWDTDEESVEIMAYFIKKFFDRSLSSYNYKHCSEYYRKFEAILGNLHCISDVRRNYWLSHYANRAAIALDRCSTPLTPESEQVANMYRQSEKYCQQSMNNEDLRLQISVDNFNRHYFYRHDLSAEIIRSALEELHSIERDKLSDRLVLDYHLLLLEYMANCSKEKQGELNALKNKVVALRSQCGSSAFYTYKLYLLEIYILIGQKQFSEAVELLSLAFEHAYRKDMRSYIYKLSYIKAQLILLQDCKDTREEAYRYAVLTLEQLLDARKDSPNDLKREIFLVAELLRLIDAQYPSQLDSLIEAQCEETRKILNEIREYIKGKCDNKNNLIEMSSYYVFENINFPMV